MGAYQNTVKWFLPLLVFPRLCPCFVLVSESFISPKDNLCSTFTQALLSGRVVKSWALNFEPPNNEICIYILSQSGWAHLSRWVRSCMGCAANPTLHPLFFSKETQQRNRESFTFRLGQTLVLSQQLNDCCCQKPRSIASHFLWWWWWWGRYVTGQGPGGFVIYLALSASSCSVLSCLLVRQNFLEAI